MPYEALIFTKIPFRRAVMACCTTSSKKMWNNTNIDFIIPLIKHDAAV
jgi:hypothetical protein